MLKLTNKIHPSLLKLSLMSIVVVSCIFFYRSNISNSKVLNVAFDSTESISSFDPTNLVYHQDYILIENLYSTIINKDDSGNYIAELATKFWWEENKLIIEFGRNFQTIDKHNVSASDAEFSLKRALLLSKNKDNILGSLSCELKNKKVTDTCDSINTMGNRLILTLPKQDESFLEILCSLSLSIIPKVAVDQSSLKIKNYSQTSGGYYFKDESPESYILEANPNFWYFDKYIPKTVRLIKVYEKNTSLAAEQLLKSGEIDHIPNSFSINRELIQFLKKNNIKFDYYQSLPLMQNFLQFTEKGKTLPIKFRQALVKAFSKSIDENYHLVKPGLRTRSNFIFSDIYTGKVDFVVENKFQELINKTDISVIRNKKITASIVPSGYENLKILIGKYIPNLMIKYDKNIYNNSILKLPYNDEDPIFFFRNITRFVKMTPNEVEVFLNSNLSPYNQEEIDSWLKRYKENFHDPVLRQNILNELHIDCLINNPSIVPVTMAPFQALTVNGWFMNFSPISRSNYFWNIRKINSIFFNQ